MPKGTCFYDLIIADCFNSYVVTAFAKKRPEPFSGLLEIEDYVLLNQITAFGRPADSASKESCRKSDNLKFKLIFSNQVGPFHEQVNENGNCRWQDHASKHVDRKWSDAFGSICQRCNQRVESKSAKRVV